MKLRITFAFVFVLFASALFGADDVSRWELDAIDPSENHLRSFNAQLERR
jgi:hypothetical protein